MLAFAGAFALTAFAVMSGWTESFDVRMLLYLDAVLPESLYGVMVFFTTIGYYRVAGVLALVAAGVFLWLGWRASAVAITISTFGGMLATTVLKSAFGRERPDFIDSGYTAGYLSFPSGHATMAVGFYGVLAAILFLHLRGSARWFVVAVGAALVALIGLSRVYLGVHYPSDVLAGYLVSPTVLALSYLIYSFVSSGTPEKN
ncbi:MAG: phosphatase PAP2 family protein [Rubrobacter sp.]